MTKKVASSSWLTQIDHRLMAAEALRNVATTMGRKVEVETRLNHRDIKAAEGSSSLPTCGSNETSLTKPVSRHTALDRSNYRTLHRNGGSKDELRNCFDAGAHTSGRGAREEVSVSAGRVVRIKSRSSGWDLLHDGPGRSDS